MELRHIRYFLAVAAESNFTRAAARLGIGQPPLSQQIRDLENEIGAQLFHRVPHGAELTEAGRAFQEIAEGIVVIAERAKGAAQRAARGEIGRLRLGFTGSSAFSPWVPGLIREYRRAYPEVDVDLVELNSRMLMAKMKSDELDVAVIRPGIDDPEDFKLCRFPDEPMVIALPAAHPLTQGPTAPLLALKDEPFVFYPRMIGLGLYDEVFTVCHRAGFTPRVVQEAPQIASVVNLVAAEMGVSIVPGPMAQVRVAGVAYLRFEGMAPVARHACAMRRGETSPAVRNFMALAAAAAHKLGA
jgi:DNA-binding transcriptional LysR family regulator